MVKIIGHDNKFVKFVTCRQCAAVLEYVPGEVHTEDLGKDISGEQSGRHFVHCPNGHKATIRSW